MNKKTEKLIFNALKKDIINLKKYSYFSISENKNFYEQLCNTIIKAIDTAKKHYDKNKKQISKQ